MSAAKVEFLTLAGAPCSADEKPARFTFRCVGFNRDKPEQLQRAKCANLLIAAGLHSASHGIKRDPQNRNGGRAQWDWNGDRENPTFTPSINCAEVCGWHGYIRNGRCVETNGSESR